jgi:large subunit ribosomal protein L24
MNKKLKSHIKIGDKIKIIAGNQKGSIGIITQVISQKSLAIIDTVLPRIRYKKNPQGGEAKKLEIQVPIHISNLMLWDNSNNQASRIGYKMVENVKKRYFKKSGNIV